MVFLVEVFGVCLHPAFKYTAHALILVHLVENKKVRLSWSKSKNGTMASESGIGAEMNWKP